MKISIKAAIALKTKALTGGLSLLFLLGGCHKKVNYFNGEIITVKDIPVSDTLTGELQEEGTRRGSERVRAVYCRNAKREKDDAGRACGKDSCDG